MYRPIKTKHPEVKMNNPSKTLKITLFAISIGLIGTACNQETTVKEVSDTDLAIAAEIMSSSLSDQADGVMASVYDATGNVSDEGITYGPQVAMKGRGGRPDHGDHGGRNGDPSASCDSSSRGTAKNATYSYDPETGIHTLEMERTITTKQFTKTMSMLLKHQFTDESGTYVVFPSDNRDSVNTINFTANKSGSESGDKRVGEYSKIDTIYITGLAESADLLTINGKHVGTGSSKFTLRNGDEFEKNHDIYIKFTNLIVDKATVLANENLEEGVTGTVEYRIVTFNSKLSDEETVVEGTLELTGDGTALMDFKGFVEKAIINLLNGETTFMK